MVYFPGAFGLPVAVCCRNDGDFQFKAHFVRVGHFRAGRRRPKGARPPENVPRVGGRRRTAFIALPDCMAFY